MRQRESSEAADQLVKTLEDFARAMWAAIDSLPPWQRDMVRRYGLDATVRMLR